MSLSQKSSVALGFDEAVAWRAVGAGWKQLYGSFQNLGVSFEWHDFTSSTPVDWSKSFHPGSVEICLNILGSGTVSHDRSCADYKTRTAGFYCRGDVPLAATRNANEQHQFITVEYSPDFLRQHLRESIDALHPLVRRIVADGQMPSNISAISPLSDRQQQLIGSLRQPPAMRAAQFLWYQSKALELMMEFFFQPLEQQQLFCSRQKAVARDRVNKVIQKLSQNLVEPPSLEELGKVVGCSHYYLSRTFTAEMGMTISQYLRHLRMQRAAELLKEGRFNVTEVAMEVGYSSISHFSAAFHDTFGCCPGLYTLAPKHSGRVNTKLQTPNSKHQQNFKPQTLNCSPPHFPT